MANGSNPLKFTIDDPILLSFINEIVEDIRANAPTQAIRKSVKMGRVVKKGDGTSVTITISAPEAGAYEYGSGIHKTKGTPAKYAIRPRNARLLSFWWAREDVRFVGKLVMHPGVAPRPYVDPALERAYPDFQERASINVVNKVSNYFKNLFGGLFKK